MFWSCECQLTLITRVSAEAGRAVTHSGHRVAQLVPLGTLTHLVTVDSERAGHTRCWDTHRWRWYMMDAVFMIKHCPEWLTENNWSVCVDRFSMHVIVNNSLILFRHKLAFRRSVGVSEMLLKKSLIHYLLDQKYSKKILWNIMNCFLC